MEVSKIAVVPNYISSKPKIFLRKEMKNESKIST
jgi:hypothetical protein